jgi:hypothetical protein
MTKDQFWEIVEDCRRTSSDVFSFHQRLVAYLTECDYPTIVAFGDALSQKTGGYPDSSFRRVLLEAGHDYSGDSSWQCYMGWLVAQGRKFYERVLKDPDVAATRLPENEDYSNDELVSFAADDAVSRKSGGQWYLDYLWVEYETSCCLSSREPGWRTQLVVNLAQAAADEPLADGRLDPARVAVLADALEEAGCADTDTDLFEHLRDSGPHLRGCWAVELILSFG